MAGVKEEFMELVESLAVARDTISRAHTLILAAFGPCEQSKDLKFALHQIDMSLRKFANGPNEPSSSIH